MISASTEPLPNVETTGRAAFFRQSGWVMLATVAGGALMWVVHFLAKVIPKAAYGEFGVYLAVVMCIPTMPLQMVLAQQTTQALARRRERELAGLIRLVWLGTTLFWFCGVVAAFVLQRDILRIWEIGSPLGLWVTLLAVLLALWVPLFQGILQGQQNFLWFGWSLMFNGLGRLAVAAIAVLALGAAAAGMMTGVLAGMAAAAGIALWHTRSLWRGPSMAFDKRILIRQVLPLFLGFGAFQFVFTADTLFVKAYFTPGETGAYVSAGTLSRALMWLVGPLAAVMFPRLVHNAARAQKSDLMGIVLAGTAVLAVCGAAGLSVLGPWVVRFVANPTYVPVAASVLPWYAAAMVPLALANVLLNALLARSAFKVVPFLCLLAVAYGFALTRFHDSLVAVLKTLLTGNLLLLAVSAWCTWGGGFRARQSGVRA